MKQDDKKNQSPLSKILPAVILLALANPAILGFAIVLGIPAGIFWLAFRASRKHHATGANKPHPQKSSFDDCPKPICFHKDKGMHHVVRGRSQDPWDNLKPEIDPWDRPDIDIRKYQRRGK